jgi:hypothetical protein
MWLRLRERTLHPAAMKLRSLVFALSLVACAEETIAEPAPAEPTETSIDETVPSKSTRLEDARTVIETGVLKQTKDAKPDPHVEAPVRELYR